MKKRMMTLVAIGALSISLLIQGCGSKSSAPAAATTKTITVTVTDGITGAAVSGVTVQLDQAGVTASTNANGVVTFSGASNGAHDIHMFPGATSGYQWESIYQTTSSSVKWDLSKNDISYVEYSGTVTNLGAGNSLTLLLEDAAKGQAYSKFCTVTGTNYTCSIQGDGIAVGQSGAFNLWALEKNASNTVVDGVQLQAKATGYIVTTTAKGGAAVTQNISFGVALPATTNLLTIVSVTPPSGVTQPISGASMPKLRIETMGFSTVLGNPIPAYNPFSATSPVWAWADGIDAIGTINWVILHKSTVGTTNIKLTSSFTALPSVAAQNGLGVTNPVIAFSPAQGVFSAHGIIIRETATNRKLWNITAPTTTISITLPTIPAGVIPILATGIAYNLYVVGGAFSGATYDTLAAGAYDPTWISFTDVEIVQTATVNFTR